MHLVHSTYSWGIIMPNCMSFIFFVNRKDTPPPHQSPLPARIMSIYYKPMSLYFKIFFCPPPPTHTSPIPFGSLSFYPITFEKKNCVQSKLSYLYRMSPCFLARYCHVFHRHSTIYSPVYPECWAERRLRWMFSKKITTFGIVL